MQHVSKCSLWTEALRRPFVADSFMVMSCPPSGAHLGGWNCAAWQTTDTDEVGRLEFDAEMEPLVLRRTVPRQGYSRAPSRLMVRCEPRTALDASSPTAERRASNHAGRRSQTPVAAGRQRKQRTAISANLHLRCAWFEARPRHGQCFRHDGMRAAEHLTMRVWGELHDRWGRFQPPC